MLLYSMSFSNAAVVLGLILIIVSTPRLTMAFSKWNRDRKLLRSGIKTEAKIVESSTYPNDDSVNTGQHRFLAEFSDDKGKIHYSKSRFASRAPDTFIGKTIIVVYDEKNPENNRFLVDISLVREIVEHGIVFLVGAGFITFGLLT